MGGAGSGRHSTYPADAATMADLKAAEQRHRAHAGTEAEEADRNAALAAQLARTQQQTGTAPAGDGS